MKDFIYSSQTNCDGLNQNECEDLSPECEYVELFPPLCDGTNCALSTDLSVCQTSNGYLKVGLLQNLVLIIQIILLVENYVTEQQQMMNVD